MDISVVMVRRLELGLVPRPWPFAVARRAEIDAHFAARRRERSALWNGRVLLLQEHAIDGGVLRGDCIETDFASFLAWRDWGFPDGTVKNFFAMGALRARDDAFLLGVMAPHTANAGAVYFPSGTPDPQDVIGDGVDLTGSLWREVAEETGLTCDDLVADPGWHAVLAGPSIALIRVLHAPETADDLRARILAHLAREHQSELSDIRIVRGAADLDPMMPPFVTVFLAGMWHSSPSPTLR
jgi:hypothetical protein